MKMGSLKESAHKCGFISAIWFTFGICISIVCLPFLQSLPTTLILVSGYCTFTALLARKLYNEESFSVAWRALLLGTFLGLGIIILILFPRIAGFGWYLIIMTIFHYTEFLATALTNPRNLSLDSYLLNHSTAYIMAALFSWLEFIVEATFFLHWKQHYWIRSIGIVLCFAGEFVRKLAMWQAGNNFSHQVETSYQDSHFLVTKGIYRFVRHPSYAGWFFWCIGTQIVLCNPICTVAYAFVSWKFFSERIFIEEYTLQDFFGKDYVNYQEKVPTGIPFIKGNRK